MNADMRDEGDQARQSPATSHGFVTTSSKHIPLLFNRPGLESRYAENHRMTNI
jgi:hypothetical protein